MKLWPWILGIGFAAGAAAIAVAAGGSAPAPSSPSRRGTLRDSEGRTLWWKTTLDAVEGQPLEWGWEVEETTGDFAFDPDRGSGFMGYSSEAAAVNALRRRFDEMGWSNFQQDDTTST